MASAIDPRGLLKSLCCSVAKWMRKTGEHCGQMVGKSPGSLSWANGRPEGALGNVFPCTTSHGHTVQ